MAEPKLTRQTPAHHPCPRYLLTIDGARHGTVTRYSVSRPKTGRWVHRGNTIDHRWQAAWNRTTANGFTTRRQAIASLLARGPETPS